MSGNWINCPFCYALAHLNGGKHAFVCDACGMATEACLLSSAGQPVYIDIPDAREVPFSASANQSISENHRVAMPVAQESDLYGDPVCSRPAAQETDLYGDHVSSREVPLAIPLSATLVAETTVATAAPATLATVAPATVAVPAIPVNAAPIATTVPATPLAAPLNASPLATAVSATLVASPVAAIPATPVALVPEGQQVPRQLASTPAQPQAGTGPPPRRPPPPGGNTLSGPPPPPAVRQAPPAPPAPPAGTFATPTQPAVRPSSPSQPAVAPGQPGVRASPPGPPGVRAPPPGQPGVRARPPGQPGLRPIGPGPPGSPGARPVPSGQPGVRPGQVMARPNTPGQPGGRPNTPPGQPGVRPNTPPGQPGVRPNTAPGQRGPRPGPPGPPGPRPAPPRQPGVRPAARAPPPGARPAAPGQPGVRPGTLGGPQRRPGPRPLGPGPPGARPLGPQGGARLVGPRPEPLVVGASPVDDRPTAVSPAVGTPSEKKGEKEAVGPSESPSSANGPKSPASHPEDLYSGLDFEDDYDNEPPSTPTEVRPVTAPPHVTPPSQSTSPLTHSVSMPSDPSVPPLSSTPYSATQPSTPSGPRPVSFSCQRCATALTVAARGGGLHHFQCPKCLTICPVHVDPPQTTPQGYPAGFGGVPMQVPIRPTNNNSMASLNDSFKRGISQMESAFKNFKFGGPSSTLSPGGVPGGVPGGIPSPSKPAIHVNGVAVDEEHTASAEVTAGPIERGESYWYDEWAGFWGIMGKHCLGIIPPNIGEFKGLPMPPNCAGGTTGVFVNGRQLALRDLAVLKRKGFPETPGVYYWLDIGGHLRNASTGETVMQLGKLHPGVEKSGVGAGMRPPALNALERKEREEKAKKEALKRDMMAKVTAGVAVGLVRGIF